MAPKHPDIEVELTGEDGNSIAIVMRVRRAMRRARVPSDELDKFQKEALSGDYDNVIATCMRSVNVS